MEKIAVLLNDKKAFDKAVHGGLSEGGDLAIITDDHGTDGGRAIFVVTFTVQLPDGTSSRAQATGTMRTLLGALKVLQANYTEDGFRRSPEDN